MLTSFLIVIFFTDRVTENETADKKASYSGAIECCTISSVQILLVLLLIHFLCGRHRWITPNFAFGVNCQNSPNMCKILVNTYLCVHVKCVCNQTFCVAKQKIEAFDCSNAKKGVNTSTYICVLGQSKSFLIFKDNTRN